MESLRAFLKRGPLIGGLVAASYGVVSIAITFFNRAVFSVWGFKYSVSLTLAQLIFSLVFLVIMKQLKLVSFADFDLKTARMVLPLSICFIFMVITGLAGLQTINVALYSALRRVTTFVVMVMEWLILGKETPKQEARSIILMVFGAMVAYYGDLQFDLIGYIHVGINCVVTAAYLVYIPKKSAETRLDSMGLIYYNNILSLPIVALIFYVYEYEGIQEYPYFKEVGFWAFFITSVVQAFLLNYLIFLCSTLNSPLTTSVTGGVKNIVQTVLGLIIFGDVDVSLFLLIGLLISTIASIWYTYLKYIQVVHAQKKKVIEV
eukprot:TRINITY_DN5398_c0_g1_i1.p1 TRINITY_DN5398_c0_g1~~TRINITY_DN5398_c0_g1_i1.p1  ORF type:complete len:319 (-),score=34.86 TRINITY_DN5398_c0_g1_i1:436-1392(-)